MSIGKNICDLRKSRGLTQSGLAAKLGVTEQSVSKWENDVCAPDVQMFPLLAKLFGVSIDRLYGFHLDSYDKEVQKILDGGNDRRSPREQVTYYETALREYPNSDRLRFSLAFAQHMLWRVGETEEERNAGAEKAESIYNEVIGTSFDEDVLNAAYQRLSELYCEMGGMRNRSLCLRNCRKQGTVPRSSARRRCSVKASGMASSADTPKVRCTNFPTA